MFHSDSGIENLLERTDATDGRTNYIVEVNDICRTELISSPFCLRHESHVLQYGFSVFLEVKLPYVPVCPSIDRSVGRSVG